MSNSDARRYSSEQESDLKSNIVNINDWMDRTKPPPKNKQPKKPEFYIVTNKEKRKLEALKRQELSKSRRAKARAVILAVAAGIVLVSGTHYVQEQQNTKAATTAYLSDKQSYDATTKNLSNLVSEFQEFEEMYRENPESFDLKKLNELAEEYKSVVKDSLYTKILKDYPDGESINPNDVVIYQYSDPDSAYYCIALSESKTNGNILPYRVFQGTQDLQVVKKYGNILEAQSEAGELIASGNMDKAKKILSKTIIDSTDSLENYTNSFYVLHKNIMGDMDFISVNYEDVDTSKDAKTTDDYER